MAVAGFLVVGALALAGCRPSEILSVPPPLGTGANVALTNLTGAQSAFTGEKGLLSQALVADLLPNAEQLSDEFRCATVVNYGPGCNVDARLTEAMSIGQTTIGEPGDYPLQQMLTARMSLLVAAVGLAKFEPANGQSTVGQALALAGYAELLMAEDYCAGVTLTDLQPGGGYQYGKPLTTDSLLSIAETHFDSALAHAAGDASVEALASVGLGRARLDRGNYAGAATAVDSVPVGFVYNMETAPNTVYNAGQDNMYAQMTSYCASFNVANGEGGNGLDFISAGDPRLQLDSTIAANNYGSPLETCDGQFNGVTPNTVYYPSKFGASSTLIPLATGVEAQLILAEAALNTNDAAAWTNVLNTLRNEAPSTYLHVASAMAPLTADSTTGATQGEQVDVMFRERAFWLFGTGTRLGDMRRLIRQYNRTAATVFPAGVYAGGVVSTFQNYGPDVSLTLPTAKSGTAITNPYYKGCLASAATA